MGAKSSETVWGCQGGQRRRPRNSPCLQAERGAPSGIGGAGLECPLGPHLGYGEGSQVPSGSGTSPLSLNKVQALSLSLSRSHLPKLQRRHLVLQSVPSGQAGYLRSSLALALPPSVPLPAGSVLEIKVITAGA